MKSRSNPISLCLLAFGLSFFQLSAHAQVQAKFSAATTEGCAPLVVQFQDESAGNPASWSWDLGNGTISFLQNPSTVYFLPGKYPVKLVVKDASGADSVIKNDYITVYANPRAGFLASDSIGCFPLKVQFTDKSIAPGASVSQWQWDFGDGNTSFAPNPEHIYQSPGNYTVTLKIVTDKGCTHSFSKVQYINTTAGITTAFADSADKNCTAPSNVYFTNFSNGPGTLSYSWDFGDGKTSTAKDPSHTYTANGTYTVSLVTVSDAGCRDTVKKTALVKLGTTVTQFHMPDSICAGQAITITNTSTPAPLRAQWNFGDGSTSSAINPAKAYAFSGTYPVKLINTYERCVDSITKPVKVFAKPVASFTADNEQFCGIPATVKFTAGTGGAKYRWDFGDGSSSSEQDPVHIYTAPGNYTVKLFVTGPGGCGDSIVKNNFIRLARPDVSIAGLPARGCLPLTVPLSIKLGTGEVLSDWHWDFGDGTSSTQAAPVKAYDTEGTFTVKLFYTTAAGCTDSVVMKDSVRASKKPVVGFTAAPTSTCAAHLVQFTNQSTPKTVRWYWDFGDGGSSTLENPLYKYNDTGNFDIKLVAWNFECPDTLVRKQYVHIDPPIARFNAGMKCDDKYFRTFTNQSIGARTCHWDFGDGASSTDYNTAHRYAARGKYMVKLTVSNGSCTDSMIRYVIVADEHPVFTSSTDELCKGGTVQFMLSNFDQSYISTQTWYYGDGGYSTQSSGHSYTYAKPGVYRAVFRFTDVNGCSDSVVKSQPIRVNGPSAQFGVHQQTICTGATALFEDQSRSDGIHDITEWNWSYGDGSLATHTMAPFTHNYTDTGSFNVTLSVKDSYGCVDSITKQTAIIISKPVAAFASADTNSCPGKPISFTNHSKGASLKYTWNFGDGQTSTSASPVHTYAASGIYTVRLRVIDAYSCSDSLTQVNYVRITMPVAGFTVSDSVSSCPPLQVQFTSRAQNYVTVKWEFGDGSSSVLENPEHYYNTPGVYYAKQIIRGPGGCTDTAVQKMVVKGPYGVFSYAPLTGCKPMTVAMKASSTDKVSFVWDFNDGTVLPSTDSNATHTYTNAGNFLPKLILVDSTGCRVPITGKDTLKVIGVTARAGMDEYRVCNEGFVQFTDRSVANDYITGHTWDFGDGSTSSDANPRHYYKTAGSYTIQHIAISAQGCRDTLRLKDTVKVWPKPEVAILGDNQACEPATLQFHARVLSGDSAQFKWQWNFANGNTATTARADSQVYQLPGKYAVQLQVVYNNFCRDTAVHPVDIRPLPRTFAGNDTFVCRDKPVLLRATGAGRYVWSAAPGLSCTDCAATMINPADNISYVVTGYNPDGCYKSDTVQVRVRQPFHIQVQPGDTLCQGEILPLLASGADLYEWYPADGLNNAHIANPQARPDKTTHYTVIGRDGDHCFADSAKVPVTVYPIPKFFAGNDTTVITGSTLPLRTVSSPDITQWKWSPANGLSCADCPAPVAAVKGSITYHVEVSNAGGCRASDDITIQAVCNGGNYFMPNTFSPNGDGSNDIFYVRGKGVNRIHSLKIFNRWGQMVFEKRDIMPNNPSSGWDGTFNGKKADMDVYVYIAEVICDNSAIVALKGDITLLR